MSNPRDRVVTELPERELLEGFVIGLWVVLAVAFIAMSISVVRLAFFTKPVAVCHCEKGN